jgi:hypothetical protein
MADDGDVTTGVFRTLRMFEEPPEGWIDTALICEQITTLCSGSYKMTISDLLHDFDLCRDGPCYHAHILPYLPDIANILKWLVKSGYLKMIRLEELVQSSMTITS